MRRREDSTPADPTPATAPTPLVARYAPHAVLQRLVMILVLVVFALLAPWLADTAPWALVRFYGIAALVLLALAVVAAKQYRDTSPQIRIDTDGLYVRAWHLGVIPWDNIALVVHSRALRGQARAVRLRRRLGDHLTVRFATFPPFQPSLPVPLGWLQRLWHALDNSDPTISARGLDTSLATIMVAIEDHIGQWKEANRPTS